MGLDTVELVMDIERTFAITIRDPDAAQLTTVGATLDYIIAELAQRPEGRTENRTRSFYHTDGSVNVAAVTSTLRRLVAEQAGVSEAEVFRHTRYVDDLGMD